MTEDEVVLITRYVRAVCPQQKIDEYTSDTWEDFLLPYSVDEARAAIRTHITRGNAFISIGEIVAEIRKAREDRLSRHTEALPPAGAHDDASYKAALLHERRAIADGRVTPTTVPALPPGHTTAPYEGRGRALLRAVGRDTTSRRPELAASCPHCRAVTGQPCTDSHGRPRRDAHPSRVDASHALAAGQPPVNRHEVEMDMERRRAASAAALAQQPNDDTAMTNDSETTPS